MDSESVQKLLAESGAVLKGHFMLGSGHHSDTYVECAKALQHPDRAGALAQGIADRLRGVEVDAVCGCALGSVVLGFEVARRLGARAIFTERQGGMLMLRRGFDVGPGERVLVVEDVVMTGSTLREIVDILRSQGAEAVGAAFVVDRGGARDQDVPCHALAEMSFTEWEPDRCPLCEAGTAAVKPGGAPRGGL